MDNNRLKELEEIEKRFKARNKYNTDYQKNNYDRTVILFDKGQKKQVDEIAKRKGFKSITEYVKYLIEKDINGAGAGSATIPDYIPTKTKLVNYSAEVLAPGADDDIKPQAEKKPAQAATNSALESRLDRLLNDHT